MIQVEEKYAPLIDYFEKWIGIDKFVEILDTQYFDYLLYTLEYCGDHCGREMSNDVYTITYFINVLKTVAGMPVTNGAWSQ